MVDEWLFSRLDSDPDLRTILAVPAGDTRIGNRTPPPGSEGGVVVVFNEQQPTEDVRGFGTGRVLARALYSVRTIGRADDNLDPIYAAARRVDALLHGQTGAAGNGQVLSVDRRSHFRFVDNDGDLNVVQLYRIQAT